MTTIKAQIHCLRHSSTGPLAMLSIGNKPPSFFEIRGIESMIAIKQQEGFDTCELEAILLHVKQSKEQALVLPDLDCDLDFQPAPPTVSQSPGF